jgi:hypothetical protein
LMTVYLGRAYLRGIKHAEKQTLIK